MKGKRGHAQAVERDEPIKCATKRKRQSVRRSVGRSACCSYPCHATLRRFLRPTRCRLRFVARLCRDCSRPAIFQHKRGLHARAIPDTGFSTHPDHIQTHTISPHKPGSAGERQGRKMKRKDKVGCDSHPSSALFIFLLCLSSSSFLLPCARHRPEF